MAKRIDIEDFKSASSPSTASKVLERGVKYCESLEDGDILFFSEIPFDFPKEDLNFLLKQKQTEAKKRKNIAYKPSINKISNHLSTSLPEQEKLHDVMKRFSHNVSTFLAKLLTPYASLWKLDYASFRPFEEKGRKLRLRARNDLLHVDAFPSRPMHGDRILRFFVNINPEASRKWITSEPFSVLAGRLIKDNKLELPKTAHSFSSKLGKLMKKTASPLGFPVRYKSPYDHFMLQMHHFLKEDEDFQKKGKKDHWEFPPFSCWMVFTDQVTHAALEGQYALEQTFIVPREALLNPEKAPISILERLSGEIMTDREPKKV